jgi:hypothetical protein
MRRFLNIAGALAAGLALTWSPAAHGRPIHGVAAVVSTSCPYGTGLGDGCKAGGGYQQSSFFTGYANQSSGVSSGAPVNLQPASYAARPAYNVGGVDYGVGLPAATVLADPANIGTDVKANPDGASVNCRFYAPGSASAYSPSGNGAAVVCSEASGPKTAPEITAYDWSLHGCTELYLGQTAWVGTVLIHANQFGNGKECNAPYDAITGVSPSGTNVTYSIASWYNRQPAVNEYITVEGFSPSGYNGTFKITGVTSTSFTVANTTTGASTGSGTEYHLGSLTYAMITTASGSTQFPISFYDNTLFGCGPDVQSALEASICGRNFPNTPTFAGVGATYGPGTVPYFLDMHAWLDNAPGNRTYLWDAWIHIPGRGVQAYYSFGPTGAPQNYEVGYQYVEGLVYPGDGEHGEFIEFGTRVNGAATGHIHHSVFLQTKHVDAGANAGSEANFYASTGSNGNLGNINSISCSSTLCTMAYTSTNGTSIQGTTTIGNGGGTTPADTIVLSGTGDSNFDGQTFTINTAGSPLTFQCASCTSADAASTGTYADTHPMQFNLEVDHNVFITNLNPSISPYWTTDIAAIAFYYNQFPSENIHDNWIDPTGSPLCYASGSGATFGTNQPLFSNNHSLLGSAGDASTNTMNNVNGACYGSQTH